MISEFVLIIGSLEFFPATASSKGAKIREMLGVAICSVLYNPRKLCMCFVFVMFSGFMFVRDPAWGDSKSSAFLPYPARNSSRVREDDDFLRFDSEVGEV